LSVSSNQENQKFSLERSEDLSKNNFFRFPIFFY
jgi:hypothetical protein